MKALKYGIALCIGLCMAVAPISAQSAQSGEVTRNNPGNNLPDLPPDTTTQPLQPFVMEAPQGWDRHMHLPEDVRVSLEERNYDQAVAKLEAFVKKAKEDPCAVALMRCTFYNETIKGVNPKYDAEAEASLKYVESHCPNKSDLYLIKVRVYGKTQPDSVMMWLDKAIEVEPYPEIYTMRGEKLFDMGETKKACADFKIASEGDPRAKMRYQLDCSAYPAEETSTAPTKE